MNDKMSGGIEAAGWSKKYEVFENELESTLTLNKSHNDKALSSN